MMTHVGYQTNSKISDIIHDHIMLSLSKVHSENELIKFMNNNDCIMSVKLDGLSISATYINGNLVRLETRGNGYKGKNIMLHAPSIYKLPKHIAKGGKYVIDGECIITYDDFEAINNENSDDNRYENPRNLASGSLTLLSSEESKKGHLRFVAWRVIEGSEYSYFSKRLKEAESLGFKVVPFI